MNCDTCADSGLEPIFEHVSFPVHSPAEQHVAVEPYDFYREPRRWEENGMIHELLEAYQVCACEAGQRRIAATKARQQQKGSKAGWQPKRDTAAMEVRIE